MSRNRVETRARTIYRFLKSNLNQVYRIGDLLAATGLTDSSTTRRAVKAASVLAEQDGLCLPVACPANGHTYCVTDHPGAAIDPSIHLGSIAEGVGVRQDVHDDFIRSRVSQLDPVSRAMFHSLESYNAAQRQQREAHRQVMKAIVAMRRDLRTNEEEAPA